METTKLKVTILVCTQTGSIIQATGKRQRSLAGLSSSLSSEEMKKLIEIGATQRLRKVKDSYTSTPQNYFAKFFSNIMKNSYFFQFGQALRLCWQSINLSLQQTKIFIRIYLFLDQISNDKHQITMRFLTQLRCILLNL